MNASELLVLEGLSLGKTLAQIAAELAVGESAVSRSVSHMERLMGLQIVDRQRHRLRLTPTGRDLALAASHAARQLRDFDDLVEQYRRGQAGRLRVLSSNSPANYFLPQVINDFLERFPDADIQLDVESGHDIWPVFAQGHNDLGIGPAEGPANVARKFLAEGVWTSEPLYEDPLVLFVSAANPLGRSRDVTLHSLSNHTFVGMYGEGFWTRFLEQLASKGLKVGRVVELKGVEGVKRLVESGQGIGVHLRSAIAREVREGRLMTLNVPDLVPPYRYVLVRRANQGQSSLVSAFSELVRGRLPEMSTTSKRVRRPRLLTDRGLAS
ncbi:MAG TPA: LysR substrate-binding domain-containing protein [Chloroflexota bacterium]|nr:LysR substrate-binding domain-containing protein [Chloroflexota bacterium]